MSKIIQFITGNKNKLNEVKQMIGDIQPFELENISVDLPEYQGKALFAYL
jgi:hypothetical protein